MIKGRAEDMSYLVMEILIKASMKMERHMEKVHISGRMVKFMMENG